MSHWNYRLIETDDGTASIHEVYYDDAGKIDGYKFWPAPFVVYAGESQKELLEMFAAALDKPRLFLADLPSGGAVSHTLDYREE